MQVVVETMVDSDGMRCDGRVGDGKGSNGEKG